MSNDFESTQGIELVTGDNSHESLFNIRLKCTNRARPATFSLLFGGDPAEGAEFEFEYAGVNGLGRSLSWNNFVALVGQDIADELFNRACVDAQESGDF